jgi:uncharacterized membrane protein YfcA
MTGLTALDWVMLLVAGALVGVAKTAIGGVGAIAVVLFAAVLPARESTGAILPLLIAGDVLAVTVYRRHGSMVTLARLLPSVLPGLLLGVLFVGLVDDTTMRLTIGVVLLGFGVTQFVQRWKDTPPEANRLGMHPGWTVVAGIAAGFTTMAANAGGPVMTMYLIAAGLPMVQMIGTGAWFFLVVNMLKIPLSASLHLITPASLALDLTLVPTLLAGGLVGIWGVRRLRQQQFELTAIGAGMLAAGALVWAAA